MKVYQNCPKELGRGIKRVAAALERYKPADVQFVAWAHEADLVIHHVVGVSNFGSTPIDRVIADQGRPYAILQYCVRTTERPTAAFWHPIWRGAKTVWSYYDLDRFCFDALGHTFPHFYYAPLGADADVFIPSSRAGKLFTIGTTGYVADTECLGECAEATRQVGGAMVHLGPDLSLGRHVASYPGVTDETVARLWSECAWVAGLRRVEGFELPAVEGWLSGARPVLLDAPHYRKWFGEFADYVPEAEPYIVTQALRDLFARPRPVTPAEIAVARERFDWNRLCKGFWERVR